MAGLEKGAVCIKTRGREAGKRVVVIDYDRKGGLATIGGSGVKRRRCNVMHLFPTGEKADPAKAGGRAPGKGKKKKTAAERKGKKEAGKEGKKGKKEKK